MSDNSTLLNFDQAGARLTVNGRTVRRMVLSGVLPGVRIAGVWRVRSEDIDEYLKSALRLYARRNGYNKAQTGARVPA
jgi:excisionase family DNA binding protein